jgi:uncharacterized protein with ACT and thioredoxin-like domain
MPNEEVSQLRIASDIMIQLQTTDMLSASMLEHIYAKNIIITGSWLPYKDLREWGLVYHEVEEVMDIGQKLQNVLLNFDDFISEIKINRSILNQKYNKNEIISQWIDLYE